MALKEINKLKELNFTKQLTFAYLTCERLCPNYLFFSENYKFGDTDKLREAIDFIYYNLFTKNLDKAKVYTLIKSIDNLIPEPADYDTVLASSALDACGAILETLNFLVDHLTARLDNISTMATDTIDMYIQEKDNLDYNNDENFQQKIDDHPLMIKEISIQKGIISYLSRIDNIQISDITTLVHLQENNKGSLSLY